MPVHDQLVPRRHELSSDLVVRRVLPQAARRHVGPFVFFDHFGPVTLPAEADSDVGPHPHIGLATVTYLFEGRMLHRDSLGTVQEIAPGAINWMTAGRGIVHSERRAAGDEGRARPLHGLQLWVALPPGQEDCAPAFQHVAADALPERQAGEARVRVLAGEAFGAASPVRTAGPTLYLDVTLGDGRPDARAAGSGEAAGPAVPWTLPPLAEEMALYAPCDALQVDGEPVAAGTMAVLVPGRPATVAGPAGARFVVVGGAAPAREPLIWWNFVASDPATIERAAAAWAAGGFDDVPGETGRLSMPPFRPLHRPA